MKRDVIINEEDNSFKILFSNNPQPMWIVDVNTLKFLAVNEAAIKHYGYTREEFLESTIMQIRPLYEHAAAKRLIREIKNNQTIVKDLTHIKKDGTVIFVHITSFTVNFHNCRCRMVAVQDVTMQKIKDEKLKTAWGRVRQTLESITDGFITLNTQFQITFLNKEAEKLLGVCRCDALNKSMFKIIPYVNGRAFYRGLTEAITDNKTTQAEQYLPAIDKWICFTFYPNKTGTSIYFANLTNERKSQQLIVEKDRRLEELAYVNSHIIRKEVANIMGIITVIQDDIGDHADLKHELRLLNVCACNLDAIIRDINYSIEAKNDSAVIFKGFADSAK